MLLLRELLTLIEGNFDDLFEDLGNLKQIDKELLKGVFDERPEKGKAAPVRPTLGQNSTFETVKDKDGAKAFDHVEKEKDVIAIVLKYGEDQILIITNNYRSRAASPSRGNKLSYALVANKKFFDVIPKEKLEGAFTTEKTYRRGIAYRSTTRTEVDYEFRANNILSGTNPDVVSKIKKLLKLVYDAAKESKTTVETILVKADVERTKKSSARDTAREGSYPLPTGNKVSIGGGKYSTYEDVASKYFKDLKSNLKNRLEAYKASKSKAFDDPNEMMKAMIKDGYLAKVKLMSFTYYLYQARTDLDMLIKKDSGWRGKPKDYNYIEYKIQSGTPELNAFNEKLDKLRDEHYDELKKLTDGEEKKKLSDLWYEKRHSVSPPDSFKVLLGLVGGVITPVAIQIGRDPAW
jgi:hypothetical protein